MINVQQSFTSLKSKSAELNNDHLQECSGLLILVFTWMSLDVLKPLWSRYWSLQQDSTKRVQEVPENHDKELKLSALKKSTDPNLTDCARVGADKWSLCCALDLLRKLILFKRYKHATSQYTCEAKCPYMHPNIQNFSAVILCQWQLLESLCSGKQKELSCQSLLYNEI